MVSPEKGNTEISCKSLQGAGKNQGTENHSELFASDCYKKCISVEEILQEN